MSSLLGRTFISVGLPPPFILLPGGLLLSSRTARSKLGADEDSEQDVIGWGWQTFVPIA
jgi:hypothetical protein